MLTREGENALAENVANIETCARYEGNHATLLYERLITPKNLKRLANLWYRTIRDNIKLNENGIMAASDEELLQRIPFLRIPNKIKKLEEYLTPHDELGQFTQPVFDDVYGYSIVEAIVSASDDNREAVILKLSNALRKSIDFIFSSTFIATSPDCTMHGIAGVNISGLQGVVALKSELSILEKSITEAHEKGHGIRSFSDSIYVAELVKPFISFEDLNLFASLNLSRELGSQSDGFRSRAKFELFEVISKTNEVIEFCAQLKNYFGMNTDDVFTIEHLNYARTHYEDYGGVNIGGLVVLFLSMITSKNEEKFISFMNEFPL